MALFRGSVVRVWDRRRLTVPARWAQQLQVVRVEPRAGLVLVVRPSAWGQRLQQGRRLLLDEDDARVVGWRPSGHCTARLIGCGDCVLIAPHNDGPAVVRSADDLLRRLDALAEWLKGADPPVGREVLVNAAIQSIGHAESSPGGRVPPGACAC